MRLTSGATIVLSLRGDGHDFAREVGDSPHESIRLVGELTDCRVTSNTKDSACTLPAQSLRPVRDLHPWRLTAAACVVMVDD